jgi:hypothetical protein
MQCVVAHAWDASYNFLELERCISPRYLPETVYMSALHEMLKEQGDIGISLFDVQSSFKARERVRRRVISTTTTLHSLPAFDIQMAFDIE